MKLSKLILCGILAAAMFLPAGPDLNAAGHDPVAVVELFTSEGCSNCPPADIVFAKLIENAKQKNLRVYALGFHVNYWDNAAWTDPFSQLEFTKRQQHYADVFRTDDVYTPQMIINGRAAFGGYRADLAQQSIAAALQIPARAGVHLDVNEAGGQFNITFTLDDAPPGAILNIAIVDSNHKIRVTAGENAGKTMAHDNVVRALQSLTVTAPKGEVVIPKPFLLNRQNASVIAYLQNPPDLSVLGAAAVSLAAE